MSFSYATVVGTGLLSPRLRRITLRVDEPDALAIPPGPDAAVGVYFPVVSADGEHTPPAVVTGSDGTRYADPQSGAHGRNYSVRHHDGDRIDIDIVLHSHGPGTAWAVATGRGDRVGLDHARSWYRPEPTTEWQLLVTDLSGLPATARIVEELPPGAAATVIAEVADLDDVDYLPTRQEVTVIISAGSGNGCGPSRLAELVREIRLPVHGGYCWFAGEAAQSRQVRKHFRELGWSIDQLDVTGYWRFDSEAWDAKYALVEDDVFAVYERALAAGKSDKAAFEDYDDALEQAGL